MSTLFNPENAPRDLASLVKAGRPALYRLALAMSIFGDKDDPTTEDREKAFAANPNTEEMAATVLRYLPPQNTQPQYQEQGAQQMTQPPGYPPAPPPNGAPYGQQQMPYGTPPAPPQGGWAPPGAPPGPPAPSGPPPAAWGAPPSFPPPGAATPPPMPPSPPQGAWAPPGAPTPPAPPPTSGWTPPGAPPQAPGGYTPPAPPQGGWTPPGAPPAAPLAARAPQTVSDPNNQGAGQPLLQAIESLAAELKKNNEILSGLATLGESNFIASVIMADRMQIPRDQLAHALGAERDSIKQQFLAKGKA